MSLFKISRIFLLLSVLFALVVGAWMTEKRMAAWERPILVTVYPIAADDRPSTLAYARSIDAATFRDVNRFFETQAMPYGFSVTPAFRFQVAEASTDRPPSMPQQFNTAAIGWWSLKMRWWAWTKSLRDGLITPDIRMFLMLHSLGGSSEMGISVGMRKGRYGIVKGFARESMEQTNLVVFTHEMLHVLGASDKYVLSTGDPIFPHGFADPQQRPLFPQRQAEIMGGAIPLNAVSSAMPESLNECKIGRLTAEEIGFFDKLATF
jgi:hypothetical protein